MKRGPAKQTGFLEEELDFERERLLNLIGSRIKRKDIEVAQNLAEDLYDVEIEFALHQKIRRLKRFNRLVFLLILFTLPVFIASTALTVLGLRPFFYLLVLAAALIAILSFILINAILVRHLGKTLSFVLETYEVRKQTFVGRLLARFSLSSGQNSEQAFPMASIKREMSQLLAIKIKDEVT